MNSSHRAICTGILVAQKFSVFTVGRNVNWCSHYGKQYGGSLKNQK